MNGVRKELAEVSRKAKMAAANELAAKEELKEQAKLATDVSN